MPPYNIDWALIPPILRLHTTISLWNRITCLIYVASSGLRFTIINRNQTRFPTNIKHIPVDSSSAYGWHTQHNNILEVSLYFNCPYFYFKNVFFQWRGDATAEYVQIA